MTYKAHAKKLKEGFLVEGGSRGFSITLDEPKSLGGSDQGISPGEMLLTSCGSCMCMVMTAFARQHGILIQDLSIDVEGDMDLLGYLNGNPRPGFQEIRYRVNLQTPSKQKKIDKFLQFVKKRCPVADTIVNGTPVTAAEQVPM